MKQKKGRKAPSRIRAAVQTVLQAFQKLRLQNLCIITLAGIINAIGVVMFLAPVNLYDSGISGTSMLLGQITPDYLTLPVFLVVLNVPLFLYGTKRQGLEFTIYSVYAVLIYSLASFIITDVLPVDVSGASPFAGEDVLLCAIFGGLISGIGSGLTIRYGGAIDGIEVMAVIFARGLGMSVGTFVMGYNLVLYIIAGVVTQSFILPLYSILTYCVAIKSVDFIVEGLDKAKSAMIITNQPDGVSARLSDAFGRGITHIDAKGYYAGQEQTIIYFVVNRFQVPKLKSIVKELDPKAFVTITEVSDVMGSSVSFQRTGKPKRKQMKA